MLIEKHAVYRGVLHGMSGGQVIQGTGGGIDVRLTATGSVKVRERKPRDPYRKEGWTRREFIDVGETRVRNVALWPYDDELLQEAVGQEVALSITGPAANSSGRHTLIALRTPRAGVERMSRKLLVAGAVVKMFKYLLVAPLLALALLFLAAIVGKVVSEAAFDVLLPVVGLLVLAYLTIGVYNIRVVFRASAALDGPVDGQGAYFPA